MSFKDLTVRNLRELARSLKTKDDLLRALRRFVPGLGGRDEPEAHVRRKSTPPEPRAPIGQLREPARPNVVASQAPATRPEAPPRPPEPAPAEPLVEGFFVARVQGEHEARSHHLTEDPVHPPVETRSALHSQENLPPFPLGYEEDRVQLLARDPGTAHLYWDLSRHTRTLAFEGLSGARAILRVFEQGHPTQDLEIALESGSHYLFGLHPGRSYRMELLAVGADGQTRRIGPSSNEVKLPRDDVSPDTSVRFMRVDFDAPLNRLREHFHTGRAAMQTPPEPPAPLEIVHHRWVPLPNSGSWQLQTWVEKVPVVLPGDDQPHAQLRFPIGGSSSWTLQAGSSSVGAAWGTAPATSPGGPPVGISWWQTAIRPEGARGSSPGGAPGTSPGGLPWWAAPSSASWWTSPGGASSASSAGWGFGGASKAPVGEE